MSIGTKTQRANDQKRSGVVRRVRELVRRNWWTRVVTLAVALVLIGMLPVPWLAARTPNPPGMAWRLDGRLQFNGKAIDPPGSWVGLTAGRPPLVAEVVRSWIDRDVEEPRDMRRGSSFSSPAMAEPAAIAIGLIEAGFDIPVTTVVEARDPLFDGMPLRISVSELNGYPISSREEWESLLGDLEDRNEIVANDGRVLTFEGNTFPYATIDLMQTPTDLEVSLAGWGRLIPEGLYRGLSLGRSHGLLLALAAYSDASGIDLADGRAIAATGVIRGDGTVGPIGGLAAKTRAARRAGVDVLIYPSAQHCDEATISEMAGVTTMRMVSVSTLTEAIAILRGDLAPGGDDSVACGA